MNPSLTESRPLYVKTPLIYSSSLSIKAGCNVFLKLENTQPCGSFKLRGIGALAIASVRQYGDKAHLICSSGGNAGIACAYAARALGVKATVFVPITTKEAVVTKLRGYGVEVVQDGASWFEANERAVRTLQEIDGAVYVPPFDHDTVVEGHSTIVPELIEQLDEQKAGPLAAVICSVGGGGLLAGILKGLDEYASGLSSVPVIAVETRGAASLALAISSSHHASPPIPTLAKLAAITTIATSMGALSVSQTAIDLAIRHDESLVSVVMEDERTVQAVRHFTNDHGFFVEPTCAASLAPLYDPAILRQALPDSRLPLPNEKAPPQHAPSVVVIVCGGSTVSLNDLERWEQDFAGKPAGPVTLLRRGRESEVS